MSTRKNKPVWEEVIGHPLIRKLSESGSLASGVSFLVVHATQGRWGQTRVAGSTAKAPEFCKLVQSTPEGAERCRLCHVLMAVAACSDGPVLQRCHAGASVFIAPGAKGSPDCLAVVSTCTLADSAAWEDARKRGEKLGLDVKALRKAYMALPRINEEREAVLRAALETISQALMVVAENEALKHPEPEGGRDSTDALLDTVFKDTGWLSGSERNGYAKGKNLPLLVRVVCELVTQRPDLPLGVQQLAETAHITPNHFTTLFRKSTGVSFVEYQTEVRMARAKKLLGDLTLNVGDVARLVGFDDPGYFARRFRQRTGMSPNAWRREGHGAE